VLLKYQKTPFKTRYFKSNYIIDYINNNIQYKKYNLLIFNFKNGSLLIGKIRQTKIK